jgi:ABC transport system ATP-binding/permease protein
LSVLGISRLTKTYGTRTVFDGVSLSVSEGEKVGFVGANGSGKSTLFRIIAGVEGANGGEVAVRRGLRVGYLSQAPEFEPGVSIFRSAAEGRPEIAGALAEYDRVARRLEEVPAEADRLLARQAELSATLDRLGGWDWQHRVEATLTRLGVAGWDRPVEGVSGGEAKRVALARTLLSQPDLLLLDEPTNHLDADTVLYLEELLVEYPGTVLLITHDRYFLDRVVDRMVEVSAGELTPYAGGYTEYLEAQAERAARQATEESKRRRLIEKELEWARRSPPARTGKQRARLKRTAALAEESRGIRERRTGELKLHAPDTARLGRTVLDLHGVTKSFGERTLIRGFSARLTAGERIGIIGPNGAGKTTLIRIILGEEPADAGRVEQGVNTRIAYFDQLREGLDPELSVYEAAGGTDWVEIGGRRVHLRSYLQDFLFPTERQQQKVASLSGGERNRLMLARLFMQPSNLLILDEPTNDLDLVTLQVLEQAVVDYAGCVLMVTHDRFFLDKIATGLFVFEGDGIVHAHAGGYDLYRRLQDEREAEAARQRADAADVARRKQPVANAAKKPERLGLSWKEQRELEGLEDRIHAAESERERLSALLADPSLYADSSRAAQTTDAFRAAEAEVETLYARWQELETRAAE